MRYLRSAVSCMKNPFIRLETVDRINNAVAIVYLCIYVICCIWQLSTFPGYDNEDWCDTTFKTLQYITIGCWVTMNFCSTFIALYSLL